MIKAKKLSKAEAERRYEAERRLRKRQDAEIAAAEAEMKTDPGYNYGRPWPIPSPEKQLSRVREGNWRWSEASERSGAFTSSLQFFIKSALRNRYALAVAISQFPPSVIRLILVIRTRIPSLFLAFSLLQLRDL